MTKAKTGRKQKHFRDPISGLPVTGLSRMTDGRWRVIGTQTRFTEPDPQKAIAHFKVLTGTKTPNRDAYLAETADDVEGQLASAYRRDGSNGGTLD